MTDPIWAPSEQRKSKTQMRQFMALASGRLKKPIDDYDALYRWSVSDPEGFWQLMWEFSDISAASKARSVLSDADRMPGARWFEGATLNFAENLLRERSEESTAIIFHGERGDRLELSWAELRRQVASVAAELRTWDVGPGDRVAGFLPNRPETVVAMLATASVGAVWSSCSPDFGADGVLDRFGQISPKVLFVTDGYFYAGKTIDSLPTVRRLCRDLPNLIQLVMVPYVSPSVDIEEFGAASTFDSLVSDQQDLTFEALPFDHPLYILYSSGTTGAPKCIVHGAGGTLLQHAKEHRLHTDLFPGDRIFYFTTCGWMMWNWLASALATGATLVLFDGSPFHPDPGVLWRMAAAERVNVFGTSAKYLSALEKANHQPNNEVELADLRALLSTGSPLAHESYDFVYRHIKEDLQLSSISGGTDIISCFALGNPTLPVYRGEIQCRGLGMKVEIFDDRGRSLVGEKGELVCTAPFPSMPVGFFNDLEDQRYRSAYFERFDNVWCHGDYAEITEHGGLIIHGRSDAVLNPGGVRIGTAEIYRVVEQLPEIAESIVIGQQWQDDVRVVLFVRMQPGYELSEELMDRLRAFIRSNASPRHVPARIVSVADIPRTISGKIVELAVRDVVHGREVKNTDALANPEALEQFRNRPELAV